jgi:hypothetical protein
MDPFARSGDAVYDATFDASNPRFQTAALVFCDLLQNATRLVLLVEMCFMKALRNWAESNKANIARYGAFPFVPEAHFVRVVSDFVDSFPEYSEAVGLEEVSSSDPYASTATGSNATIHGMARISYLRVVARSTTPWNVPGRELTEAYKNWMAFLEETRVVLNQPSESYSSSSSSPSSRNDTNTKTRALPQISITASMFVRMATERAAVDGVVTSIAISTAFAVGSVIAFTGDAVVAFLAAVSLFAVVVSVLGTFALAGWELGIVEAISITVLVGLSCDFSLHLAEAFTKSARETREDRGKDAVARVGKPVIAAGATTFFAVLPMLGCTIRVLHKFGSIIPACILFSLFFSLFLFVPLLMVFGPRGDVTGEPGGKRRGGLFREVPSVLFRSSARRCSFFLAAGTFLCLVVPATRAIALERLDSFLGVLLAGSAGLYVWLRVERAREEAGQAGEEPVATVQGMTPTTRRARLFPEAFEEDSERPAETGDAGGTCGGCGEVYEKLWKFCPECGASSVG